MAIEFYNVKKREKVQIDDSNIEKVTYEKALASGGKQIRYALKAVDSDGTKLTKFCSKDAWESIGQ